MRIDNFDIEKDGVFIIAEIGNNHNGSYERAIKLIDLAQDAGANCVKFQIRHLEELYRESSLKLKGDDLGTEYVLDLLKRFELSLDEHIKIREYCSRKGISYMCTPWDKKSLLFLENLDVPAYKIASADLTNLPLIKEACGTNKPLILSTGMSTQDEVRETINFLNSCSADFALLHCNSTYPAPLMDINLNWMKDLKKMHNLIGYSGHERGVGVSIGAVAMGAQIIERHFTLDRKMEGPDHAASLEPNTFKELVSSIRDLEQAMGTGGKRVLSQGEMINRENLGKSIVAKNNIDKGTLLTSNHFEVKSPGQGLSPLFINDLIGKKSIREFKTDDYFFQSDIEESVKLPRDYDFAMRWGLPVRYHDFNDYSEKSSPDLFEFHLSYSDMKIKISDYIDNKYEAEFAVHAPELFEDSHLMDLTTNDTKYLNKSISETQKVIDITRELNEYFPNTKKPPIVANIGGFSLDEPFNNDEKLRRYEKFANTLDKLDMKDVELIPQTMAPFPWHFGGQRFQNIFVLPDEIDYWCKQLNIRMCLDVSHSKLTCNHFGLDFYDFLKLVSPHSTHLHLGDALGVNGEGLQIDDGDIDFIKMAKILMKHCPDASFIPEIWQGHKDSGRGFWIALEKLENYFKEV